MDFLNQQFNQFNQRPQQKSVWQQSLRARYGFAVGIVVGILIGWFFHGVVSLVLRLGVLMLLLVPLIVIAWLYLRSRRSPDEANGSPRPGPQVFTIGNAPPFMRGPSGATEPTRNASTRRDAEPVIELNDDDYDLERFKKRLEQDS